MRGTPYLLTHAVLCAVLHVIIELFSKSGEACAQYLARGRQVGVEGKLHARSYDDKSGIRRKAVEVVADRVYFLDRNRQEGQGMVETPEEGDFLTVGESALAETAQA